MAVSSLLAASAATAVPAFAEPNVVVSIKPIYSLVASVMRGVGEPKLLLDGNQSPHSFSLKPSQAAILQDADAVIWVGHSLEVFLEKSLRSIAPNAKSIELMEAKGIHHVKSGGHDHHDDDHGDDGGVDDDHAVKGAARDPHIWLDTENAHAMVGDIAEGLAALDPENADLYRRNVISTRQKIEALTAEIAAELSSLKGMKFMAFHDAYGHFEHRFGVESAGSLTINPEVSPGARRLRDLQARVKSQNIKCVFSEPQFDANAWRAVIANTDLRLSTIDPLGVHIEAGPDMYGQLVRGVASSLKTCMTQ
ncbi:MAG: zinc ABC transporter substrate-binding protein [Rhizobiaceae bacterium]